MIVSHSKINPAPSEDDITKQRNHMERKIMAREQYNSDILAYKLLPHTSVCCFDLENVLSVPHCTGSSLFYSRKLSSYNLTVYNLISKHANNYIWNETEGKRGSSEIGTCLYQFINAQHLNITHFIFFSDSCGGQNRNIYVSSLFHHIVRTSDHIQIIDHKFLEKGHTYNGCDSECNSRNVQIVHPREWFNTITSARKHRRHMK